MLELKKTKKRKKSGFGILKGMRSFTKEDEFDSCIDNITINKKVKKLKVNLKIRRKNSYR